MENIKLSIIIPVYNAEKYLRRCVDSILEQRTNTLSFELLLIDDGSTDKSGAICDEYALRDNRIRVFHKSNGGVSSARNIGLNNAKGEWLTFVDSDDMLLPQSFDIIEYALNNSNEDLLLFDYCENENTIKLNYDEFVSKEDFIGDVLSYRTSPAPWGKLYKTANIQKKRFNESLRIGEDLLFIVEYAIQKEHNIIIRYIASCVYKYVVNNTSIMHTVNKSDYLQLNAIALPKIKECMSNKYITDIALFELVNIFYGSMKAKTYPTLLEDKRLVELFEQIKETHNKIIDTYMHVMKYSRPVAHLYLWLQNFKSFVKSIITLRLK